MRGADAYNEPLFTRIKLEDFVPATHPLRPIRTWVNDALAGMDGKFSVMYEAGVKGGRPSIAPEKLMRAMLLQVLYSVRSDRRRVEQIQYKLAVRGPGHRRHRVEPLVFSKNRDRLSRSTMPSRSCSTRRGDGREKRVLLSGEHFSVDHTIIQAWASHKGMRRKDDVGALRLSA
jgi:transposase